MYVIFNLNSIKLTSMRKFYYLSFFALILSFNTFAQKVNLEEPLPVNQKIKKGVLENGMTYYIYNTDVTKNAASYYIIQNVGSVLENDDQQGLAHFLEHMAFNGTKNFAGKGILNTLQKYGAVFGKDIHYKNFILGIIVGHFSTEEYQYYRFNSSELNKRILKIVAQRVQDSLEQVL